MSTVNQDFSKWKLMRMMSNSIQEVRKSFNLLKVIQSTISLNKLKKKI